MCLLDVMSMLGMAWNSVGSCFREAGFITHADPAKQDKDGDDEVSCDAWSNLQEELNIRSTSSEFVQAHDAVPSHGELSLNKLCYNVSSNPDKREIDGPVVCDCPSVPTCSEAMEYLEKYEYFL
jgi:hypothetical protein